MKFKVKTSDGQYIAREFTTPKVFAKDADEEEEKDFDELEAEAEKDEAKADEKEAKAEEKEAE